MVNTLDYMVQAERTQQMDYHRLTGLIIVEVVKCAFNDVADDSG